MTQLQGVQGVQEPHFWTLCSNFYVGGLKLEVSRDADPKYVISHTQMIFRAVGVSQLFVQLDYEHNQGTYQNLMALASDSKQHPGGGHGHSHDHGHDHHDHYHKHS